MADNKKTKYVDNLIQKDQFIVMLGNNVYSFAKVSNLTSSIDYEVFREGGVNDAVQMGKKPKESPDKLVLERGISIGNTNDKEFAVGTRFPEGISVAAVKNGKKPKFVLHSDSCMVVKWEYEGYDATVNGVMIKKIEILHNGFVEKPVR